MAKIAPYISPHEHFIGMLLNDSDFLDEKRDSLKSSDYAEPRLNTIVKCLKSESSENYFKDFYLISKDLCLYAMNLSNAVAYHKINQKGGKK